MINKIDDGEIFNPKYFSVNKDKISKKDQKLGYISSKEKV